MKKILKKNLFLMLLLHHIRLLKPLPKWLGLAKRTTANRLQDGVPRKRVLIGTSVGAHLPSTVLESLLAQALRLRNADVDVLLCDGVLSACLECMQDITLSEKGMAKSGPKRALCFFCYHAGKRYFRKLGLSIVKYSTYLDEQVSAEIDTISKNTPLTQISDYHQGEFKVGEHAMAGALRFYARGTLEIGEMPETILRRYFKAALQTTMAMDKLLSKKVYDCAVFLHGIYVPHGPIGEVCRSRGVRVVNWNPAYRKKCFIFSHNDTYHHTMMTEPTSTWENIPWSKPIEEKITAYLKSRWVGSEDWIKFLGRPNLEFSAINKELKLDSERPIIGLLTNVFWDAQLHYPSNVFPNMLEWLLETIDYFAKRMDLQLVVRIHPAEINGSVPSRQKMYDEVLAKFHRIPENIRIIKPENEISTYAVMERCDSVIIYGTKTGVELTSIGIPVVVAGEAWIRNKGITLDARSREEYFRILAGLPLRKSMEQEQIIRARKYAYHFFFRKMIALKYLEPVKGWPPYRIKLTAIEDLEPGKDNGLDVICDGILGNKEFIYKAEKQDEVPIK